MTISLRLSEQEAMLFKKYAELKNINVSELVRQAVMERIEDELDLQAFDKAMEEYKENPVTYSHDEVRRMLEL
ncbi:MAG: ribbon-helix-helix protein, CopG family [Clostridiales bacterium]|nr:ribbon-helix-helix protein, CopG family [Clostridiales bacterium]